MMAEQLRQQILSAADGTVLELFRLVQTSIKDVNGTVTCIAC